MAAATLKSASIRLHPCSERSMSSKTLKEGAIRRTLSVISSTQADLLHWSPLSKQCTSRKALFGTSLPNFAVRGTAQHSSPQRKGPIRAMSVDAVGAATSAMKTFLYPVGTEYIWNVVLPLGSIIGAFGAYKQESSGKNSGYSKFARESKKQQLPSKWGMFSLYLPAALLASWWLLTLGDADNLERVRLVGSLLAVHFWKRVLEILFVHK